MARVKLSPLISSISGKLGGASFKVLAGKSILAGSAKPKGHASSYQQMNRLFIQAASQAWRTLTDGARSGYIRAAKTGTILNIRTGKPFSSGYNLFVGLNYSLWLYTGNIFEPDPTVALDNALPAIPVLYFALDPQFLQFQVSFGNPLYDSLYTVFATSPYPSYRKWKDSEFRFIKAGLASPDVLIDLLPDYLSVFKSLGTAYTSFALKFIFNSSATGLAYREFIVTPVTAYLFDVLSVIPKRAWSVRQLNASYIGHAITLRRSSDNTTRTFDYTNGILDQSAISSWAAGSNIFVKVLFDQSGTGNDLFQNANADQPQFILSSTPGGNPSVKFNGTNQYLAYLSSINVSGGITVVSNFKVSVNPTLTNILVIGGTANTTNRFYTLFFSSGGIYQPSLNVNQLFPRQRAYVSGVSYTNTFNYLIQVYNGGSVSNPSSYSLYYNGTSHPATIVSDGFEEGGQKVGTATSPLFFNGNLSELLIFDQSVTAGDISILNSFESSL